MNSLSTKQKRVLSFPNSKYDALICDGSVRSGKTSVMSVAFIMWAMRDFSGCNFAICSKTVQTAFKNVVRPLLGMTYLKDKFSIKFSRSTNELTVTRNGRTNTFYIYGGKDEASYQLIQGITLAGVFLDEVALMPKSFVEQALARCSIEGSRFWFSCNPVGPMHWFKQEWIDKAEQKNALYLHFTMDDNPSLSEQIKRRYENMYTGVFYKRYILGLWVAAEGLVYDMFDAEKHVRADVETDGEYIVSADFGMQNATVFLFWRKEKGKKCWHCFREYRYSGREERKQKTIQQMCDDLEACMPRVQAGDQEAIEMPETIIVDPSASAMIAELRHRGYRVRKAKNDVLAGITETGMALYANILSFDPSCKGTLKEFDTYSWDIKKADNGEDVPIKENDHSMDAVRYFVKTMKLVKTVGDVAKEEQSEE